MHGFIWQGRYSMEDQTSGISGKELSEGLGTRMFVILIVDSDSLRDGSRKRGTSYRLGEWEGGAHFQVPVVSSGCHHVPNLRTSVQLPSTLSLSAPFSLSAEAF